MKLAAIVAALSVVSGCAMTFQERPPKVRVAVTHCAESSPLPVIDLVAGSVAMAAAAGGLSYAWGRNHEQYVLPFGAMALGGMIALGSAFEGFRWVSECRDRSGVAAQ